MNKKVKNQLSSKKAPNLTHWLMVGLVAQLITAPNITFMKVTLGQIDPTTYNTLRSAVVVALALPFIVYFWRRFTWRNFRYAVGAGISTTVAVTLTTYAVQLSQASYVVVLSLMSPIVLVLLSSYFFHERVSFRAAAGVTLAAIGALGAVAIPLIIGGRTTFAFYPLATAFTLCASLFLAMLTICLRKANEAGLPLTSAQGVSSTVVMTASFLINFFVHRSPINVTGVPAFAWFGIAYSGILVIFIARIMGTASYERIGSAATSGLNYLGTILALLIPILFLHEQLSIATVIGGVLILCGVYLTERHQAKTHRHWHLFAHH